MAVTVTPDEVRALIDTSLSAKNLPDTTVNRNSFKGAAIREIKARYPTADAATGDDVGHFNTAADALTAARLVPSVPNLTGEKYGDQYSHSRKAIDVTAKVAELRQLAESELSMIEDTPEVESSDLVDSMPQMFGLASGRRGA